MHEHGLARVERIFDGLAPSYESDRWYIEQGKLLMQHFPEDPAGAVLDVGCGTGWLLRQVVGSRPGLRGIGLDLSARMVAVARRAAERERLATLSFFQADWESVDPARPPLELASRRVGTIVCVSAFHYFADPLAALAKMRRVLAPGGQLLLLDRDMSGSPLTWFWNLVHGVLIRDHVRYYTSSRLRELLGRAGFVDVDVRARVRRMFWHGKLTTSLVLLSARAAAGTAAAVPA